MAEQIGLRAVLETKEFQKGMKIYLSGIVELDRKTGSTTKGINSGLQSTNKGFLSANGGALAFGATVAGLAGGIIVVKELGEAIIGVGAATLNSAADMEQQLANISSLMGGTAEETQMLKDLITDLGLDPGLKVSATEAADSIELLVRNGVELQDIMDGAARSSIALANATGADFGTAADIGTDAMTLFNIQAKDMNEAVNGITSVVTSSKFDINDYRLALAQAGGVASSVGIEFDDFNTSIAAIAPLFASGSDAGTSFKTFLQRLAPTTQPAIDAMTELGLFTGLSAKEFEKVEKKIAKTEEKIAKLDPTSKNYQKKLAELNGELEVLNSQLVSGSNAFFDSEGNMKSMSEISVLLSDATAHLSEEEKNLAFSTIFGTDAMRAAFGLARAGETNMVQLADGTIVATTAFDELQDKMGKTDAAELIEKRMDTLQGTMEIIGGVFETVGIKIGEAILPTAKKIATRFLDLTERVMPLVEPALVIIEQGISSLADTMSTFLEPAIDGAINMLSGLLGIGTNIGVTADVSGLDDIRDIVLPDMGEGAEPSFFQTFKTFFADLPAIASDAMATVSGVFSSFMQFITGTVLPGFSRLADALFGGGEGAITLSGIWEGLLKPAIESVGWWIENILTPAFNIMIDIFSTVLPPAISALSDIWTNILVPAISKVAEIAAFLFQVWQDNMPVFQRLAEDAFGRLQTIIDFVSINVMPFFLEQLDKLFIFWDDNGPLIISTIEQLGKFAQISFSIFMGAVKVAWGIISPLLDAVIDIVLEVGQLVMQVINGDWKGAWISASQIVMIVFQGIISALWGGIESILELFGTNLEEVTKSWQFVWDSIKIIFDNALITWGENWDMIIEIVSIIWENIKESFAVWGEVWGLVETAWGNVLKTWGENWEEIKTTVSIVWENIKENFAVWGEVWGLVETAWGNVLKTWGENWDSVLSIVDTTWTNIQESVDAAFELVKEAFNTSWDEIKEETEGKLEDIKEAIDLAWDSLLSVVEESVQEWKDKILESDWVEVGSDVIGAISEGIEGAVSLVESAVSMVISQIGTAFTSATQYVEIGSSIIGGIIQGISDSADSLFGAVSGVASGILDAIKSGLGIASPSKEAIRISEQFIQGLKMGVEDGMSDFQSSLSNLFDVNKIKESALDGAAALSDLFATAFEKAERFAMLYFNTIRTESGSLKVFSTFGGEAIDINDQLVLSRINALDVLNKQQDALGLQLRLFDQINKLGLDFEELTFGIQTGPNAGIVDVLELQVRLNRELVKQDEDRLSLAEKQAKLAEKEAEIKKLQRIQSIIGGLSAVGLNAGDIVDGIVLGLETSESDLLDLMIAIADNQVAAMEDTLGIASPSKRFMEIGRQSMAGLAIGARDTESQAINAVRGVSNSIIQAPIQPGQGTNENSRLISLLTQALNRPNTVYSPQITNHNVVDSQMRLNQMNTMINNQVQRMIPR